MKESDLDLDSRKEIYKTVKDYPGLHMRAVHKKTGMSLNLVKYHLEKLEKMEMVNKIDEEGYKRYYPVEYSGERLDYKDRRLLGLLRKEIPLGVVVFLLNKGGKARHKEISENLDLPASTLSYHLKKLEKKNIIKKSKSTYEIIDKQHVSHLLLEYAPPDDLVERFIDGWEDFTL